MIIPEPFGNKNYPTHNFIFQNRLPNKIDINLIGDLYICNKCNLIIRYYVFKNLINKELNKEGNKFVKEIYYKIYMKAKS